MREEAVAHVEDRVRLQFGIGRHLHHFLESLESRVVVLLLEKRVAQIELRIGVVGTHFEGFLIIDLRLGEVLLLILAVTLAY